MFTTRLANSKDYDFLFELKKAAEYEPIKAIFGWDETLQKKIHQQEWNENKPIMIEVEGSPVGSYLVEKHADHLYFGRFFLLPSFQGKGIGSAILESVFELACEESLPIKLCYLQGNRVGRLYSRLGFEITKQDSQFVYMCKVCC